MRRLVITSALAALCLASSPHPAKAVEEVRVVRVRGGGHLGVVLEDVRKEDVTRLKLAGERGALVRKVEPDTPAAKAGVKEGDVILRYQGETVQSAAQLSRLVRETPPGRTVSLDVNRQGAPQALTVALDEPRGRALEADEGDLDDLVGPLPPVAPIPPHFVMPKGWGKEHSFFRGFLGDLGGPRKLGIDYQEISGQLAHFFHVTGDQGILVTSVEEGGPASRAGLRAGDVLLKVGSRDVHDARELREALEPVKPGQSTPVSVLRDGRAIDLTLTAGGGQGEHSPTI